jgi:hypothetical protein
MFAETLKGLQQTTLHGGKNSASKPVSKQENPKDSDDGVKHSEEWDFGLCPSFRI